MNYTLYKLETGFIVVSDEKPKVGEEIFYKNGDSHHLACYQSYFDKYDWCKKLIAQEPNIIFSDLKEDEQKKIGWFDVKSKVKEYVQELIDCKSVKEHERTWISAICHQFFIKVQELLVDRRFTLEDMRNAFLAGREFEDNIDLDTKVRFAKPKYSFNKYISKLEDKSWPVELEILTDGKVRILKVL